MSRPGNRDAAAFLWQRLRGRRCPLARVLLWTAVESLPAFLAGGAVAAAVDQGFLAGEPFIGLGWLTVLVLASVVGAAGARGALLNTALIVEPLRDTLVTGTVEAALRDALSSTHFQQDASGVARLTRQVEIVREAAGSILSVVCRFAFSFIGVCVGTLTLEPVAALLVFVPVALGVAGYVMSLRGVVRAQRRSIVAGEDLAQEAWRLSAHLRDITACGIEEAASERVDAAARENAQAEMTLARLTALRTVALGVGGWVPLILVLVWARWGSTGMSAGTVLGVLTYIAQNLRPAVQTLIQGVGTTGIRLFVTLDRLLRTQEPRAASAETVPRPARTDHGPADADFGKDGPANAARLPRAVPDGPRGAALTLESLSFSFVGSAGEVLRDVELRVEPGEHIAVVGPSGIGKSMLASLIAGTRAPTKGCVRIDGADLAALAPSRQARLRTYLPQEAYVFTGTLRENLSYLVDGPVDDQRLDHVLGVVGLEEVVAKAGGYDEPVEPDQMSSGERQLIALARAHLSPARLTILDEATCHLHPAAEAKAEKAMKERPGTLIVIAHRISSAQAADRVMVLDGGAPRVGSHDEMIAASSLYRDLVGLWAPDASAPPAGSDGCPPSVAAAARPVQAR